MAVPISTAAGLDAAAIRADFPVLAEQVHERPLVYLDNAATSQKPRAVIDALQTYYETYNANIHRGLHALSERATAEFEDARVRVARFINAAHSHEVIFTRGTTESINLVARGWGDENVGEGDEILLTEMEHHSNLVPWQMLARRRGASTALHPDGCRRPPRPRGVRADVWPADSARDGHAHVKRAGHHHAGCRDSSGSPMSATCRCCWTPRSRFRTSPVDVQALDADFVAFSGHKMLGPTGIGVLYGRESLLDATEPLFGGGSMIRVVELHQSSWTTLPDKLEGGTPNIAGAIGLGAAVDYLQAVGMLNVTAHEHELTEYALNLLSDLDGVQLFGPKDARDRGGVISFYVGDVHPHDVGTLLDAEGIAVRAGHHCAQPLMRKLGVAATARASLYLYNTAAEVDCLADGIARAKAFFA